MIDSLVEDMEGWEFARPGCKEPHGLPLNPFRTRIWKKLDGTWSATYKRGLQSWGVNGCESPAEASADLRHFVRIHVAYVDGDFREVVRR